MDIHAYFIFLTTTIIVCMSPGPAVITIASQGARHGAKKAIFGVTGVASANVVYFLLSATGIASLLVASNFVFSIIKWVGVAYLVYLGVNAIVSKSGGLRVNQSASSNAKGIALFSQGFIVELANPKALLYFLALLPQFIDIEKPILLQLFIMGASCLVVDLLSYTMYACIGQKLSSGAVKASVVNMINKSAGGFLLFAGIKMASVSSNM
ncbi:Lysine exporter protein (LYSE/YGGA) [Paraglaciecola sp. T6c]|uniref:LysE family translocator n=1 Tax=Pseudoalteromonas atlantica (strain T6c / ATCC BAA-1087) TaxID=3042615 RepID=UPI00005C6718|nr:LysE family translocator [Paraglaciecola sp. T6c]ABG39974.1 Lysine exporter protein (LYSE/YGGA) [Paraglaciecola sp. T6c]